MQESLLGDALARARRAEADAAAARGELAGEASAAAEARERSRNATAAGSAVRDEAGALRVELACLQAEVTPLRSSAKVGSGSRA